MIFTVAPATACTRVSYESKLLAIVGEILKSLSGECVFSFVTLSLALPKINLKLVAYSATHSATEISKCMRWHQSKRDILIHINRVIATTPLRSSRRNILLIQGQISKCLIRKVHLINKVNGYIRTRTAAGSTSNSQCRIFKTT